MPAVHKRAAPPFSKFLQNRAESWKVFNMSEMLLLHTNPTVYHTHRFDKRLKSLTLYEIRKSKTEWLHFFNLKFLLNSEESEKVFYIWMERLIDTFPTVYHTHHSDKRLNRNFQNTPAVKVVHRAVFETALNPWAIKRSVQHSKDAPFQYESNGVSYAQFRQTVKKLKRKRCIRFCFTRAAVLRIQQCGSLLRNDAV